MGQAHTEHANQKRQRIIRTPFFPAKSSICVIVRAMGCGFEAEQPLQILHKNP
jgi:hypothetical protein